MNRRGWIVWTWGKLGGLMVFMGMMVMLLTAYSFTGASAQVESANRMSANLRNLILDTHNSVGGMSFEYGLPKSLRGEEYSLEVLDKQDDMVGIIARTKSGMLEVSGGASLAVPMSNNSFGTLKDFEQESHYICIVKHDGLIYLEGSRCS